MGLPVLRSCWGLPGGVREAVRTLACRKPLLSTPTHRGLSSLCVAGVHPYTLLQAGDSGPLTPGGRATAVYPLAPGSPGSQDPAGFPQAFHSVVTWSGTGHSARPSLSKRDSRKPASSSSSSSASPVSSSSPPAPGPRRVFSAGLQAPQPWASGSEEALWSQASVGGGKRARLRKGHMAAGVWGRPGFRAHSTPAPACALLGFKPALPGQVFPLEASAVSCLGPSLHSGFWALRDQRPDPPPWALLPCGAAPPGHSRWRGCS